VVGCTSCARQAGGPGLLEEERGVTRIGEQTDLQGELFIGMAVGDYDRIAQQLPRDRAAEGGRGSADVRGGTHPSDRRAVQSLRYGRRGCALSPVKCTCG
jgi:hypothetical protein